MNYFVKGNPDLCIGCRTCMIGCVVSHEGKHIFEVDPDSYTFNPKLQVIKTAKITVPVQCKHCESPACMAVCSLGAIIHVDNAVIIDKDKCIGCKTCMAACPFGAIDMVPVTGEYQSDGSEKIVANKCDLCTATKTGPVCVKVCPTQALELVTEEDLRENCENKRIEAVKYNVQMKK